MPGATFKFSACGHPPRPAREGPSPGAALPQVSVLPPPKAASPSPVSGRSWGPLEAREEGYGGQAPLIARGQPRCPGVLEPRIRPSTPSVPQGRGDERHGDRRRGNGGVEACPGAMWQRGLVLSMGVSTGAWPSVHLLAVLPVSTRSGLRVSPPPSHWGHLGWFPWLTEPPQAMPAGRRGLAWGWSPGVLGSAPRPRDTPGSCPPLHLGPRQEGVSCLLTFPGPLPSGPPDTA